MFTAFASLRGLEFWPVFLKVVLAAVCGLVIGLERSAKNRPAGFRTHVLVCLGACTAALTGLYLYLELRLVSDVSRIGAQVISGLGFIGAGTIIITKRRSIKGLTTAAGLWTTGIIGLGIGFGYYEIGILGTVLVLLTEIILGKVSLHISGQPEYKVEVLYNDKTSIDHVLRYMKDESISITNLMIHSIDSEAEDEEKAQYRAVISLRGGDKKELIQAAIIAMDGVVDAASL